MHVRPRSGVSDGGLVTLSEAEHIARDYCALTWMIEPDGLSGAEVRERHVMPMSERVANYH